MLGGDLVVHRTKQGALTTTSAHAAPIAVPSTTPTIPATQVMTSLHAPALPRLVVWAGAATPVLAWESVLPGTQGDGTPSERRIVSDATTGAQLYAFEGERARAHRHPRRRRRAIVTATWDAVNVTS